MIFNLDGFFFENEDDVERLLIEIMTEARNLTQAERCSLFLLDKQHNCLIAKVMVVWCSDIKCHQNLNEQLQPRLDEDKLEV